MSALTTHHAAGGVQLPLVPEPLALKRTVRALAEEHPDRAAELLTHPDEVAAHLWERWCPDLERAGMSREEFLGVLAEYRRELWYWIWGNRTWAQCSHGLAGRLARRAGRSERVPPAGTSRAPAVAAKGGARDG